MKISSNKTMFDDRMPYEIKSSISIERALELEKTLGQSVVNRLKEENSKKEINITKK